MPKRRKTEAHPVLSEQQKALEIPRRTHLTNLPTEILDTICEKLDDAVFIWNLRSTEFSGYTANLSPARLPHAVKTLSALCLSCKTLLRVAQPRLFRTIVVHRSIGPLLEALIRQPHLRSCVRYIDSTHICRLSDWQSVETAMEILELPVRRSKRIAERQDVFTGKLLDGIKLGLYKTENLLTFTPNVYALTIILNTPYDFPRSKRSIFNRVRNGRQMPLLDSLQSLKIDCCDHNDFTKFLPTLNHILSHAPNLRHLTLLDLDTETPVPISQSQVDNLALLTKDLVNLKSFTVGRSNIFDRHGEVEYFSKWFNSCTTLEACFIELANCCDPWEPTIATMTPRNLMLALAPTRQTLMHLSLDIDDLEDLSTDTHISVRQLAQFTKLETLRLSIGCLWDYDPNGLNLADAIPVTLRRMALIFNAHNVDGTTRGWLHLESIVNKVRAGEGEIKLQYLLIECDNHYTMKTIQTSRLVAVKRALAGTNVTVEAKLCGISILPRMG